MRTKDSKNMFAFDHLEKDLTILTYLEFKGICVHIMNEEEKQDDSYYFQKPKEEGKKKKLEKCKILSKIKCTRDICSPLVMLGFTDNILTKSPNESLHSVDLEREYSS